MSAFVQPNSPDHAQHFFRPSSPSHLPTCCCRRGNFLYDAETGMLNLIDFGAARDYPPHFVVRPGFVFAQWRGQGH